MQFSYTCGSDAHEVVTMVSVHALQHGDHLSHAIGFLLLLRFPQWLEGNV